MLKRNSNNDEVFFIHFPGIKYHKDKRERWIRACHRGDRFVCGKDSYICSLHFVGENGPTVQHPDPLSAVTSAENVSQIFFNARFKTILTVICANVNVILY